MAKPAVLERQLIERSFDFETRADDTGDGLTLTGYAAVFDTPTRINDWDGAFDEIIARGAFKKTIAERMPVLQWNHGNDPAIGQVPIGSITALREDRNGLYVEARLHANQQVQPVRDAIASGAVTGMSFRFQVMVETVDESGDIPTRTVKEVRLFEVGPVAFPAYPTTSVGVRSLTREMDDQDPAVVVESVDAAIDAAQEALKSGDVESALALLNAADIAVDALIMLLGATDPGDDPAKRSATYHRAALALDGLAGNMDAPPSGTRSSLDRLRFATQIEKERYS